MRKLQSIYRYVASTSLFFAATLFAGCRKELCYDHLTGKRLLIGVDWSAAHAKPKSICVRFYKKGTPGCKVSKILSPEGGEVNVEAGIYDVLIYSSDYFEEDGILYRGLDNYETAEAYAITKSSSSLAKAVTTESVIHQPDYLYAVGTDNYRIKEDDEEENDAETQVLSVLPHSLVYTYSFDLKVEGMEYVREVQGTVSGMYESVFLKNGERPHQAATVFFEGEKQGDHVTATVRTFGAIPSTEKKHVVSFRFLLNNGKVEQIDIDDYSEALDNALPGEDNTVEIEIEEPVIITSESGEEDNGFNPGVEDWTEVEIPLPM